MKWTKVALVLLIPVLALSFLGQSVRSPAVEAKPTSIVTINPILCLTLSMSEDWDGNTVVDSNDTTVALTNCTALHGATQFDALVNTLGGDPLDPKPEDVAAVDVDGGQMHEEDGTLFIIAFVSNDGPVAFYADEGTFPESGGASIACGPGGPPDFHMNDEDCDNDGIRGNGVVIARLRPAGGDRGEATVRVRQGMLEMEEPYKIVGEPHDIEITQLEPAIQNGAPNCAMFASAAEFPAVNNAAEKSVLLAKVLDDDGTLLTGALVAFETDDENKAVTSLPLAPTLDLGALGSGAPNVICGTDDPGVVTLTARITTGQAEAGVALDPEAGSRDVEAEYTVRGLPTSMTLSAEPPSLVCDGVNSSTVSAALTDDEGNPAVNGTSVRFDVKALGIASPINAKSADGAAKTTVTPFSGIGRGVVVKATMLIEKVDWGRLFSDFEDFIDPEDLAELEEPSWRDVLEEDYPLVDVQLEGTILVQCSEAAPPAPAPPVAPAPAPAISPPATGSGGCLP